MHGTIEYSYGVGVASLILHNTARVNTLEYGTLTLAYDGITMIYDGV